MIRDFFSNPEWDTPFFKCLAHNDTGQAAGNQAGMVFPKELRKFLPDLDEAAISSLSPTTDKRLHAELYLGGSHISDHTIRYQLQTWGGTRSGESRITDGFQPLRNQAAEGDVIIFQRRADTLNRFRLFLVKKNTAEFDEIKAAIGNRRWGPLYEGNPPMTQDELAAAGRELTNLADQKFQLIKPVVTRIETRQTKIARSAIFRERVRYEYGKKCSVSGIAMVTPTLLPEVESAHVVAVSVGGTDDIRNGFALTHTLHWAFDKGLFGVLPDRKIYIPKKVKLTAGNEFLLQFDKRPISEARTPKFCVHPDAFLWHMENLVKQWD
jgi:putative restriction endonuclease